MQKIEESSLRMIINTSRSIDELDKISRKICDNWGSWPMSLFFDLKHRILKGQYISEECLVDLIIVSRSKTLYFSKNNFSIDSQIKLMKSGLPDINLERKIAQNAADNLRKRYYGSIEISLKALRDFGTRASLTILEIAEFDMRSNIQVEKIKCKLFGAPNIEKLHLDGLDVYSKKLTSSLNVHLAVILKEAILAIKKRDHNFEFAKFNWSTL